MPQGSQDTTTRLLAGVQGGDRAALDALFPHVYDELRTLARQQRQRWQGDYTLNTTALAHEAYLRLVDQTHASWESRAHFMGVAAKAMRSLLVDYARRRRALKRGGDAPKVSFDEQAVPPDDVIVVPEKHAETLLALDEALRRLEDAEPRWGRVVECRFFGRMTVDDTAAAVGVSRNTVKRDWNRAQLWLYRELRHTLPDPEDLDVPG